jgi:hypothetical protein
MLLDNIYMFSLKLLDPPVVRTTNTLIFQTTTSPTEIHAHEITTYLLSSRYSSSIGQHLYVFLINYQERLLSANMPMYPKHV